MAENANWPSDSCPAQPLRIVSEDAAIGEDHHPGPQERLRRLLREHRDEQEHREDGKHPDARQLPHHPHAAHALGATASTRPESFHDGSVSDATRIDAARA